MRQLGHWHGEAYFQIAVRTLQVLVVGLERLVQAVICLEVRVCVVVAELSIWAVFLRGRVEVGHRVYGKVRVDLVGIAGFGLSA